MDSKKIKFLGVCITSCVALTAAIVAFSQNNGIRGLPAGASNNKSFVFDSSVGATYFNSNWNKEKTISTGVSSNIHAGVNIKNGYTSDIRFGGSEYFLEKQEYAMACDYNFLVGANNITSFSLQFRMVNYFYGIEPSSIRYNVYVYFYDEDYNISTALSEITAGNDNYVDPIYSSGNIGSTGVEKNTYYTVSWTKPNEATYTARHMRLYFSLAYGSETKDTYANVQFKSLTINWEC